MNDLFVEIQKIVPPGGTPHRVLYQGSPDRHQGPSTRWWEKWPSCRIRPQLRNPASREAAQDRGVPEKIRKGLAPPELDGRVPARQRPDLRGPDVGSHRLPELRAGLGLRIGPGLLSGTKLRIERQTETRVRPMHFRPPPPFRLTTQCRNHSPLHPLGPPRLGNHGFLRADDTRSSQPENLLPLVRVSGRVSFPEHPVFGRRERRRQVTRRMRLLFLRT